jgi:outer membrane protein assembly factor BamD
MLATLLLGCPSLFNGTAPTKASPEELFKEGEVLFSQKQYGKAVDTFERLKSAHPEFKKMPEVYLRIADGLFENKAYDKSIDRYRQFIELYPLHKEVPRAKYQIGLAYFSQIRGTDLDNSVVERSMEIFKLLAMDSEAGEWAKKADEKVKECRKKLAEKELYKAWTYMSMKDYAAARVVVKRVLDEYAGLGLDAEAKELMAKVGDKLGLSDEAKKTGKKAEKKTEEKAEKKKEKGEDK